MRAADQINIVLLVKFAHYSLTKREAHATIVVTIGVDTTFWIRPQ